MLFFYIIILFNVSALRAQIVNPKFWLMKKTELISILGYSNNEPEININSTLEVFNKHGDPIENIIKLLQRNDDKKTEDVSSIDTALDQLDYIKQVILKMKEKSLYKNETTHTDCKCVEMNTCPVNSVAQIKSCDIGYVCCNSSVENDLVKEIVYNESFSTSIYSKCGLLEDMTPDIQPSEDDLILLDIMPWILLVKGYNVTPFTGTIIHPKAAITLASKANKLSLGASLIQYIDKINFINIRSHKIVKIILHPKYNANIVLHENDIAILTWDKEIEFGSVSTLACVPPPKYNFSIEKCMVSEYDITGNTKDIKYFNVSIGDGLQFNVAKIFIETHNAKNCSMSGGGPMICSMTSHRRTIAGLIISDNSCTNPKFVDVSYHSIWINDTLVANGLL